MQNRTHYNRGLLSCALGIVLAFAAPVASLAQTLVPTIVGGSDNGTTRRTLLTDSSGRLQVVGSAAGGVTYGPDAPNTTGTQSPVRVGGCTSPLSNACTVINLVTRSDGSLTVSGAEVAGTSLATDKGFMVGGSDGTNYRHFKTDSAGVSFVQGPSVVGSATGTQAIMVGGSDGTLTRYLRTDTNGYLRNIGTAQSGAADDGTAPIKIGGVYNLTLPTLTAGQRGDLQLSPSGSARMSIVSQSVSGTKTALSSNVAFVGNDATQSANSSPLGVAGFIYNGSTQDATLSATAANGTAGTGVPAAGAMGFDGSLYQNLSVLGNGPVSGALTRDAYWNETTTPLTGSATFTGTGRNAGDGTKSAFAYFNAFALADQVGTLRIDCSNDNTTFYTCASAALTANTPAILQVPVMTRYHRAVVVNGATTETVLKVNSSYTAS